MKKIAITGSSGFLGKALIKQLRSENASVEILGIDQVKAESNPPNELLQIDIRDSRVVKELVRFDPDAIIHLAFVLNPIRNERVAKQIHLKGFYNVLDAASRLHTPQLMIGSSATAYGATSDDESRKTETAPLCVSQKLRYSADKVHIEKLLKVFQWQYPKIQISSVRPCMIGGPGADNFITRFMINMPFVMLIDGYDLPLQFTHVDDVTRAMSEILRRELSGPFNIGPQDIIRLTEIAHRLNKPTRNLPQWFVYGSSVLSWYSRVKFFEASPGFVPFSRYPWLIDSARLESECDFSFEYSSREAFEQLLPERFHR